MHSIINMIVFLKSNTLQRFTNLKYDIGLESWNSFYNTNIPKAVILTLEIKKFKRKELSYPVIRTVHPTYLISSINFVRYWFDIDFEIENDTIN